MQPPDHREEILVTFLILVVGILAAASFQNTGASVPVSDVVWP
jgi:Tfp pilus assembly protein PilV